VPRAATLYQEAVQQRRLWGPALTDMTSTGLLLHANTNITPVSNRVSSWRSVFNQWAFEQTDNAARPTLAQWTLGETALQFTGPGFSPRLIGTALFTPFESATAFTVLATINATGNGWILSKGSSTPTERVGFAVIGGDVYFVINSQVLIAAINLNTNLIVTFTYNAGQATIRVNGAPAVSGTLPPVGAAASNRLIIGPSVDPAPMQGVIRDIVVLPYVATLQQIERWEGYLHWRGNQTTPLIAAHSFRNRPPLIGD
jgi:hypothetical protein